MPTKNELKAQIVGLKKIITENEATILQLEKGLNKAIEVIDEQWDDKREQTKKHGEHLKVTIIKIKQLKEQYNKKSKTKRLNNIDVNNAMLSYYLSYLNQKDKEGRNINNKKDSRRLTAKQLKEEALTYKELHHDTIYNRLKAHGKGPFAQGLSDAKSKSIEF